MSNKTSYDVYDNMTKFGDVLTKSKHKTFHLRGKWDSNSWGLEDEYAVVAIPRSLHDKFQMKNVFNSLGASIFCDKTLAIGTITLDNLKSYVGLFQDCKIKVQGEKLDFGNVDTSIENMFGGVVFDGLKYGVAIRNGSLYVRNAFNGATGIRGLGFNDSKIHGLEGLAVNSSVETMAFFRCQFLDGEPNALDLRLSALDVLPLGLKLLTLQSCDSRFVEYMVELVNKDIDAFSNLVIDIKD